MMIVALAAILLGLYVHIYRLIEDEDDFAMSILLMEGEIVCGLAAVAWGCWYLMKLARKL
jgi:hypothetical protein